MSFSTPHDTSNSGDGTQLVLDLNGVTSSYIVTNIALSNTNPGMLLTRRLMWPTSGRRPENLPPVLQPRWLFRLMTAGLVEPSRLTTSARL